MLPTAHGRTICLRVMPSMDKRKEARFKRYRRTLPTLRGKKRFHFGTRERKAFENMCAAQCTMAECAAFLGIARSTLDMIVQEHYEGEKFGDVYERLRLVGNVSLRRKQFQKALTGKGDTAMLKWLGINVLGQTDRVDQTASVTASAGGETQIIRIPAYSAPKPPPAPTTPLNPTGLPGENEASGA